MSVREARAAAKLLGKLGGLKGGPARARSMTKEQRHDNAVLANRARQKALSPEQRSALARKAALARHGRRGAKKTGAA